MSFTLTENAELAAKEGSLTPNIVLEIEGISTVFGTVSINKYLQYGDPINYGENYVYGGLIPIQDQKPYISFGGGTTTSIRQSLNIDRGTGESISSISVALIDQNEEITQMITPGNQVSELLGRKVSLWMGFESTAWKDDYVTIFRGNINAIESKAGIVTLKILHPDNKKNSALFAKAETELTTSSINFNPSDVNIAGDFITINNHGFSNLDNISFSSTGALPSGLSSGLAFNVTTNTFQMISGLSATSVQNFTDQGSGVHTGSYGLRQADNIINVIDDSKFLAPVAGPSGSFDDDILFYVRIDDELIRYESKSGSQFSTLTRGALGTVANTHDSGATVESFIRLNGNPIELALKLMASGKNGPYDSARSLSHFGRISPTELVTDVIFFKDISIEAENNVIVGDYITTTGAANGANNVSLKVITGINETNDGSYITVSGAGFIDEADSVGTISFRSQYDTLGDGLKMANDEIDIAEHLKINNRFTSTFQMDLYVKDTMDDVKAFISEQLLNPIGCYNLPRKSRSSLGIHNPPLPDASIKIFNDSNVKNASTIKIERSLTKNFFNAVLYKYDEQALDDKFLGGLTTIDGASVTRFGDNVGTKPLIIESKGLRSSIDANAVANTATQRRLAKYKFGAESIREMKLSFSDGFNLEIGDVLMLEMENLKISDIQSGTRSGEPRLWEVENKSINLKTGDISVSLTDTNFDKSARYGLISASSFIKSGSSNTTFVIEESFNSIYGINEFKKWQGLGAVAVRVRSVDFSTIGTSTISSIAGNTIVLNDDLGFTPSAGMLLEFDVYTNQPASIKLLYAFMSDGSNDFADGGKPYNQY